MKVHCRPHLAAAEYLAIARDMNAGRPHEYYGHDIAEVLSDVALALTNEATRARSRIEHLERTERTASEAVGRLWPLIWSMGKRKLMPVALVREALEGDR